jgi:dolichol-phosphate mannosyltransferase
LENSPELIPALLEKLHSYDVVVASRNEVPRFSEKLAAQTLGRICCVSDFYSNFRAYKRETIVDADLKGGETFGGELLIIPKKKRFRIGEVKYDAPPRRRKPRIGGSVKANWRISVASIKCWFIYLF